MSEQWDHCEHHCEHHWWLFAPAVWVMSMVIGAEFGAIFWAVTRA